MTGGYDLKPYTSKAKKAIDLAARISKKMNYSYVGTEHILAGLIKEGTGVAAEVLTACNVEYDKLISMIEDLISPGDNIEVSGQGWLFTKDTESIGACIGGSR